MVKDKERARFVVTAVSEGFWESLPHSEEMVRSSIKIEIFGTTDAFKVRGFFNVTVADSNLRPAGSNQWQVMQIPNVVKKDSPVLKPEHQFHWWTKDDRPAIFRRDAFLVFYGMIVFEDTFGDEHVEEFGFYWWVDQSLMEAEMPGSSRWVDCESENSKAKWEKLKKKLWGYPRELVV